MKLTNRISIWLKRLALLCLLIVTAVSAIGLLSSPDSEQVTPFGMKRVNSFYVPMSDGVELAVDLIVPADLSPGQRIPAMLRFTRYTRSGQPGILRRIAQGLGLDGIHPVLNLFNNAGYAVLVVDARGSGASSGARDADISPQEVADMSEVVDWVVQQKWSNGKVGAFGVSYVGTTSEMLTANENPAVKAVLPLFSDFDGFTGLVKPGGVEAKKFTEVWAKTNHIYDTNNICAGKSGFSCWLAKLWTKGVKPVDADVDGARLAKVIDERVSYDLVSAMRAVKYIDDEFAGGSVRDLFPSGNLQSINRSGVPMQVWVSWLDAATVDGAIARYNTLSNPQQLIITPFNHGGSKDADPFKAEDAPVSPSRLKQYQERIEFLDGFLKNENSKSVKSGIRYYTLGEGVWKTTDVWPPKDVEKQRWYFNEGMSLSEESPKADSASDLYKIDFEASTGENNRWLANLSGSRDIIYRDRAQQDERLLVYNSAPLEESLEITGTPIVTLQVSSTHTDGAFHVYFEDVAPDGNVTYITEGILRAVHRKVSPETPPYYHEGPYHSYKRKDAQPLVPGEPTEVKIGLIATSVLVKKGHRLRIAIAGHDASVFERIPSQGVPTINVYRNKDLLSFVEFPVVKNSHLK